MHLSTIWPGGALLHHLPDSSCLLLCSLVDFPHNCTLRVKQQQQWNWFATLQNISTVFFTTATLPPFIFCPAMPAMHNTILKPCMPEMHLPIKWTDGSEWESQLMQTKVINFHAKNACNNLYHTRDSKYLLSHFSAQMSPFLQPRMFEEKNFRLVRRQRRVWGGFKTPTKSLEEELGFFFQNSKYLWQNFRLMRSQQARHAREYYKVITMSCHVKPLGEPLWVMGMQWIEFVSQICFLNGIEALCHHVQGLLLCPMLKINHCALLIACRTPLPYTRGGHYTASHYDVVLPSIT